MFRNENEKIKNLVKKDQKKERKNQFAGTVRTVRTELVRSAAQGFQPGVSIPRFLIDSSWEHHGHCYFRDQFTLPTEADGSPGPLDSIPLLYTLCQGNQSGAPSSSLRAALDAAAFACMANHANVFSLTVQARKKYGHALRHLSQALESLRMLFEMRR